jgi:polyisoprenoid-binding protein YceI
MSTRANRTHLKRWLFGSVGVVGALCVGGPFVYIHYVEGQAPATLTLSTQTTPSSSASSPKGQTATAAASTTPVTVQGTWNVAPGSVAGYRVKETLFGQSTTAVGRTKTITGSVTIRATQVIAAQFSVDMTAVKSDQGGRDAQFQGRIMDTASYPTATFALTQPINLGTIPAVGTTVSETAMGKLTLHGITKVVAFAIQARRTDATLSVSGSIPVVFADYGIPNPSFGPAATGNNGTLEFLLDFSHA